MNVFSQLAESGVPLAKAIIDDVATLAGVSIKTVSRVMNREANVRASTREKVMAAAKELDYRPNLAARGLAGKNNYLIGVLYDNPSPSYLMNVQAGVLETCRESGYGMVLQPIRVESDTVLNDLEDFIAQSRVGGLVLTPPVSDQEDVVSFLLEAGIPHVLISPSEEIADQDKSPIVTIDNRRAARKMTRYLIEGGHERIGFIKGHPAHGAGSRRFLGYLDALDVAGIPVDEAIVKEGLFSFETGQKAFADIWQVSVKPTAIFAANDDMAAGVIHDALELGLKLPHELSVVGFDDTPISRPDMASTYHSASADPSNEPRSSKSSD